MERQQAIDFLADCIATVHASHPLRVAIDGRTASGKTTIANELASVLRNRGHDVIRTSIDGFHRPRVERYRRGRFSAEGYLDDARDWASIRWLLLEPLGPDGNLLYRTTSFDLDKDVPIEQAPTKASQDAILIVDGTFLQNQALINAWDIVIFVSVSEETAIQRGIKRDDVLFGGADKAREMHIQRYQPAFTLYQQRANPEKRASFVVDNNDLAFLTITDQN